MKIPSSLITGVALFALCAIFVSGQADLDARIAQQGEALVKQHVVWKTKLSSPGASIRVKEVGRQGSLLQYHLYVSGLPSNQLYRVSTWPITQPEPSELMEGVSLGKDGIVTCAGRTPQQCGDPSQKDDPIEFTFNATKGEPSRIALAAGSDRAAVVIVPNPITSKDKGLQVACRTTHPAIRSGLLYGSGVSPQ
jgi:hypothetical protein